VKQSNILARLKDLCSKKEKPMADMHVVKIHNKKAECSCGWDQECLLGAQAKRLGYVHAQMNIYSKVEDLQDEYPDGFSTD